MEFTNFTELVRNEVEKRTGDGHSVQITTVTKNNGVVLRGITVLREGCNISPTIYLNDFYGAYRNGTATIGTITDDVMDIYERNKIGKSIDMDDFLDYETAKHHIVYKLVNTERNRALLEGIPHVSFYDLSIVFEYLVSQDNMGTATILISNAYMKTWDIDTKELYQTASINTPVLRKYELRSMNEVLREVAGVMDFGDMCDSFPIYVLRNETGVQGAACILYPRLLRDFAEASQSDLFIIPSSVHETLILPHADPADSVQIKEMIRDINETAVDPEEVLSDNLYIYEQCTNELRML